MSSRMEKVLVLGLLLGVLGGISCSRTTPAGNGSTPGGGPGGSRRTAIVDAVERVSPTVVGVVATSRRMIRVPDARQRALFPFFPNLPRYAEGTVPMLGSGIVLDSRGYFLTNHHLVGEADSIWVLLSDGRHFPAEVRGTDKNYDLAVIRVVKQGEETFETAPLGNSDDMMVGEWVVALGNPYGQYIEDANPSVTAGVVSALHRDIKISEGSAIYKDMIQTDAAINPGNSGGPLVNADGEVIGINTFIFSESGGSLGIGFAIPINIAIEVAGELILYGHIRGVWIGIGVQELTEFYARQLGVEPGNGLLVWSLEKGSPSEQAGIRLGDVIRGINGKQVRDADQAKRTMFGARSGDTITFQIEREGQMLHLPVTLESLPGNG